MFAALRHLLPTGRAWRAPIGTVVRQVLDGLSPALERLVTFAGEAFLDQFSATTRELVTWEEDFGLYPWQALSTATRRANLAHRQGTLGRQDPRYLETELQYWGFECYVHEPWATTSPLVPHDPRSYTEEPRIGTWRCGLPGARLGRAAFRLNSTHVNPGSYWQAPRWTGEAPAQVPSSPTTWPHFLYLQGAVFGTAFDLDAQRFAEFQYLVERIKPAHCWVVATITMVDNDERIHDTTFDLTFN